VVVGKKHPMPCPRLSLTGHPFICSGTGMRNLPLITVVVLAPPPHHSLGVIMKNEEESSGVFLLPYVVFATLPLLTTTQAA